MPAEVDADLNARAYQESGRKQAQKRFFGFGEARHRGRPRAQFVNQVIEAIGHDIEGLDAAAGVNARPNFPQDGQLVNDLVKFFG